MNALGIHLILELKECNRAFLNDLPYIEQTLVDAAGIVGAHIVGKTFHKFSPHGITGVVAIAESHLCIHTWPEYGYAAVDIFTCGETSQPQKAVEFLVQRLESKAHSVTKLERGHLPHLVRL